jgi:hypothetical protein
MRIDRDAVATATLPISTWAETIGDDGTATTWILTCDGWYSTLDDGPRTNHLPAGGVRIVGMPMTVCAVPALDDMEVRYADESESDAVFAAVGGPFYDEGEHLLALLGSTPEGVGFVTPQKWVIAPYEMSYGVEVGILAWERADDDDELGAPVRVVSMPADVMVVP